MFKGVFTDLITPFNEKQEVLYGFYKNHLEFLKKNKIDGVIVHGLFGEYPSLMQTERIKILENVIKNRNSMKVFPFLTDCCIFNLIELYRSISHLDFDAVFVGLPYFYPKLNEEGLFQFLDSFFKELKHPAILVNVPQYTGNKVTLKLVEMLSSHNNFLGLADYMGDLSLLKDMDIKYPKMQKFIAVDSLLVDGLKCGAVGIISPLSNVFPKLIVELYSTFLSNPLKAQEVQMKITGLKNVLSKYPTRSSIKYAMLQQGFPKLSVRMPLRDLMESEKTVLKSKLTSYLIEEHLIEEEEAT